MTITTETLTWIFKDPDWKNKLLIGSALIFAGSAIPVIGWLGYLVMFGYTLIIMRAVLQGKEPTLPKWENFGELFVDGLKAVLASAGFWIPAVLAFICAFGAWFGFILSLPTGRSSASALPAFFPFALMIYFFGLMIGIAFGYAAYGIAPLSTTQYLRTGKIGAGYRLREMIRIVRADLSVYFLTWVIFLGLHVLLSVAIVLTYATVILCFALPFVVAPIYFYLQLMWAVLFGTAYRQAIAKIPDLEK